MIYTEVSKRNRQIGVYCFYRNDAPIYVGCSIDIHRRSLQHKRHGRFLDCDLVVLEITDEESIWDREKYWIQKLNTVSEGENKVIHNNMDMREVREAASMRMRNSNPMKKGMTNEGSFKKGHKPTITEERNELIRQSKIGKRNPNYNNPDAAKVFHEYLTCEKCGATMNIGNFKRWNHGSECKK